jgi:glutathione S-transferase
MPRYAAIDAEYASRLATCPPDDDGPVFLVNFMKYRARADYGDGDDRGASGRDADDRYAPVDVLAAIGAEIVFFGDVEPGGEWDRIGIVRYPTRRSVIAMQSRPDFQQKHVHKAAGMERTIVCGSVPLMAPSATPGGRVLFDLVADDTPLARPADGLFSVEGTLLGDGRPFTRLGVSWLRDDDAAPVESPTRVVAVVRPQVDRLAAAMQPSAGRPIPMVGMPGSPYSRKLRAVLRYRRIPYAWVTVGSPEHHALPRPRVELLPQLVLPGPDGTPVAETDSTPLIHRLEREHAPRGVIPPDPVVAFLDALVEDYADEWLTKAMFHYRWAFDADVAQGAAILPRWFRPDGPNAAAVAAGRQFADRQIGRLGVVGSNPTTAPTIESSYARLLALLDGRLAAARFVMGGRPGASDFALYGQLTQLAAFDPTPRAIALADAPRVVAWVDLVEDLSGLEPLASDWIARGDASEHLRPFLTEIGRVYVPFLLANAAALDAGASEVACTIDGRPWTQRPFPYQRKCLHALRAAHAALAADDRRAVDAILAGTGCEPLTTV